MKQIRNILMTVLVFGVLFVANSKELRAAEDNQNVCVTVPSNVNVTFREDGTNAIGTFQVQNESQVPIHVTNVKITEYNGWKLVPKSTVITVDQKRMAFSFNGKYLAAGNNEIQVSVLENSVKKIPIEIVRGAWNDSHPIEKAMEIELEYKIGTKDFRIVFDGTGSDAAVPPVSAKNGDTVHLPVPSRAKYKFLGWQDAAGNLYQDTYQMPIGDVALTAKWQWMEAYAFYAASDKSLTFIRSVEPIQAGMTYEGKKITEVYTGFEETMYGSYNPSPWIWAGGIYGSNIVKVEVKDIIQPKATTMWFFCMRSGAYFDLEKLDMSKATNMVSMFSSAGEEVTGSFTLKGVDKWDMSNMKYMGSAFRYMGKKAKTFVMDDVSGWNTPSAVDMFQLFYETGMSASWKQDCSKWNVPNVTSYGSFCEGVEGKVVPPNWVH